ncbi:hypothetical protein OAE88_00575 [bacterium]|nr:hypothetical protein [bacterium]
MICKWINNLFEKKATKKKPRGFKLDLDTQQRMGVDYRILKMSRGDIARKYNVSYQTAGKVINGTYGKR